MESVIIEKLCTTVSILLFCLFQSINIFIYVKSDKKKEISNLYIRNQGYFVLVYMDLI